MLNLFYAEPDDDRWLPFDRFPRRWIRHILRGRQRPGGQMRVFLDLMAGLDRLGVEYTVNDTRRARKKPDELCCILGKRQVLDRTEWKNPLMLGPCIHDHPCTDPDLFRRRRVRRVLVPGEWMKRMCEPAWGERVFAWPVGVDTDHWSPAPKPVQPDIDVIIYDKLRWDRERSRPALLLSVQKELERRGLRYLTIRYGHYAPNEYRELLRRARSMVFICEHETQGIAYQEALATGVPVLAWDHGGYWTDPCYYPHQVVFSPVSSVPYWDERCGVRFSSAAEFPAALDQFETQRSAGRFSPRDYVLDHLTLEKCASAFVNHASTASSLTDA